MEIDPFLLQINDALDDLRDATFNHDFHRASRLKRVLDEFLPKVGYTLAEDPMNIYVLRELEGIEKPS